MKVIISMNWRILVWVLTSQMESSIVLGTEFSTSGKNGFGLDIPWVLLKWVCKIRAGANWKPEIFNYFLFCFVIFFNFHRNFSIIRLEVFRLSCRQVCTGWSDPILIPRFFLKCVIITVLVTKEIIIYSWYTMLGIGIIQDFLDR